MWSCFPHPFLALLLLVVLYLGTWCVTRCLTFSWFGGWGFCFNFHFSSLFFWIMWFYLAIFVIYNKYFVKLNILINHYFGPTSMNCATSTQCVINFTIQYLHILSPLLFSCKDVHVSSCHGGILFIKSAIIRIPLYGSTPGNLLVAYSSYDMCTHQKRDGGHEKKLYKWSYIDNVAWNLFITGGGGS